MRIELEARGVRDASDLFSEMGHRIVDPSPVWRRMIGLLMRVNAARFKAQPWAPLDEDTRRRKKDPRILHLTGTLERALTAWGAPGQRLDVDPDGFTFGLTPNGDAYYGRFHHFGESNPRRPVMEPPPYFSRRGADWLLDYLTNGR